MSRTDKDAAHSAKTVLKVTKREDGTFDIFLNQQLHRGTISETYLADELCARFGFCGEEYQSLVQEVHTIGSKTLVLRGGTR